MFWLKRDAPDEPADRAKTCRAKKTGFRSKLPYLLAAGRPGTPNLPAKIIPAKIP